MDAAHKRKDAPEKESKNTSHSASAEPQAKKLKNEKDDNKQVESAFIPPRAFSLFLHLTFSIRWFSQPWQS